MRVRDIMEATVKTCRPRNSLMDAGRAMRDANCGSLPVIDEEDKILGMLTDRDICLFLTKNDARPSQISVDTVMTKDVHTCQLDDDVADAVRLMSSEQIRRLPVVDDDGRMAGILSIDDVLSGIEGDGSTARSRAQLTEVLETFRSIHRKQQLVVP